MIDKLTYDDFLTVSSELRKQASIIQELANKRNIQDLIDFAATVEGYSKFLENTVDINKDADSAIQELKDQLK